MHAPFDIAALTTEQAAQALPLVQATWPDMDLASWEEFIRFFADRRRRGQRFFFDQLRGGAR